MRPRINFQIFRPLRRQCWLCLFEINENPFRCLQETRGGKGEQIPSWAMEVFGKLFLESLGGENQKLLCLIAVTNSFMYGAECRGFQVQSTKRHKAIECSIEMRHLFNAQYRDVNECIYRMQTGWVPWNWWWTLELAIEPRLPRFIGCHCCRGLILLNRLLNDLQNLSELLCPQHLCYFKRLSAQVDLGLATFRVWPSYKPISKNVLTYVSKSVQTKFVSQKLYSICQIYQMIWQNRW